jgi:hypothetical protein
MNIEEKIAIERNKNTVAAEHLEELLANYLKTGRIRPSQLSIGISILVLYILGQLGCLVA